jgi:transposase InsO family protein
MSAHQAMYPIRAMARVLKVSASGYYAWRSRPASARATADADLTRHIRTIHAGSHATYGAPRVHAELKADGLSVGRKRIARLMRAAGIAGVSRAQFSISLRGSAALESLVVGRGPRTVRVVRNQTPLRRSPIPRQGPHRHVSVGKTGGVVLEGDKGRGQDRDMRLVRRKHRAVEIGHEPQPQPQRIADRRRLQMEASARLRLSPLERAAFG